MSLDRRNVAGMRPPTSDDEARRSGEDRSGPRRFECRDLMGTDREVVLIHNDAEYRLRITSNDKLILTK